MADRRAEFEGYVRRQRSGLLRSALLLTAGDAHLAEDVVQTTLMRLYVAWPRIAEGKLDAYARKVLVSCLIDHRRRPFVRREVPTEALPDVGVLVERDGATEEHAVVWQALRDLPARMRLAVVLRHVEDLSVSQVADAMHCREGTVKSQTARGLDKVREAVAAARRRDRCRV